MTDGCMDKDNLSSIPYCMAGGKAITPKLTQKTYTKCSELCDMLAPRNKVQLSVQQWPDS